MLEPYLDPVGYPTIGWGSRYDKDMNLVTMQTPAITLSEADYLLYRDIQRFSYIVNRDTYNINQNQFDALVSFCYNLGNINGLKNKVNNSTLTRQDFTKYVYAKGIKLKGLEIRRNLEADLYFTKENLTSKVARYFATSQFIHNKPLGKPLQEELNRDILFTR